MSNEIVLTHPPQPSLSAPGQSSNGVDSSTEDALMGEQLTAQYHRATGGMREVLRFGAMMLILEQRLSSTCGIKTLPRGVNAQEGGVKGWIARNAPEITIATAWRFKAIAESVQEKFALPAKVRKSLGFAGLVTAESAKLTEKERKLQQDLFAFIDGTSQRSWLDGLKPKKLPGGATGSNKPKELLPPEEAARKAAQILFLPVIKQLNLMHQSHAKDLLHLPVATDKPADEASLKTLIHHAQCLIDAASDAIGRKTQSAVQDRKQERRATLTKGSKGR